MHRMPLASASPPPAVRSEEHTSELQSHRDLHSFPTRRSSDLNTNLRIALRVTDASESSDVIDAPDAARISKSTPGRAYVRLGASSLVPFQAGRVGGRRPGAVLEAGS